MPPLTRRGSDAGGLCVALTYLGGAMDELTAILPRLTESQIEALKGVALAMVEPGAGADNEFLTAAALSEAYGVPESTIRTAMREGRLDYVTPYGQARPRSVRRSDFERWMGRKK